jgi:farnesyl-diphosphate farnesyltransferase
LISFFLTHAQKQYLKTRMQRVSRSFAVVLPLFDEPMDAFTSIAYLLCRVADNIEDCERPADWKHARFAELRTLLERPALAPEVLETWSRESWPGLDEAQARMMGPQDGPTLWQLYALVPDAPRSIVRRWVLAMADGMEQSLDPGTSLRTVTRDGVRVLADEESYHRYCYFVAGTVGHMLTDLAVDHYRFGPALSERMLRRCESAGRALQKTNILKDFADDLRRGWCYLPATWLARADWAPLALRGAPLEWKREVFADVLAELEEFTRYVLELPSTAVGYRLGILACLLPAYQTVLLAAQRHGQLFTAEHDVKISRECLSRCLADGRTLVRDDAALLHYGVEQRGRVEAALAR